MKITRVEVFPVDADGRTLVPLLLETDSGEVGYGEAGLQRRPEAIRGAFEHLRPVLLGKDPRRIEHIWQTLYRGGFYPADRIMGSCVSAVDVALWDLKAKALGVPLYELFGGLSRDRVYCYTHNPIKLLEGMQTEKMGGDAIKGDASAATGKGAEAGPRHVPAPEIMNDEPFSRPMIDIPATIKAWHSYVDQGWRFLRMSPPVWGSIFEPRPCLLNLLELMDAARREFGDGPEFLVDLHARLHPSDAIWFCREAEQYRPFFIEDALRAEYIHGYDNVRRHVNVPLAVGEHFASKWEFRELIERDLIDFARIDIAICCGLTEARKIAGWCETHHIRLAPHNPLGPINLAAGLHLNLTANNGAIQEMPWLPGVQLPHVFTTALKCERGALLPPDAPGLGVTFDPEAATKHGYYKTEPPHIMRLDGSFTNY